MTDISVLIVDDEDFVLKAVRSALQPEQISVTCAGSSREALQLLSVQDFDVILLDIMMPEQDGFSLLRQIRSQNLLTPVILLSGREEDAAQVEGLGLGADDYMTKPFRKAVLVSKIRALVRRSRQYAPASEGSAASRTLLQCGDFTLHLDTQTVLRGETELSLSSKEFSLLCFFAEHPDTLLTKQELFSKVWKSDATDDNTILVYIRRLRGKIEEDPSHPRYLLTEWGKGYRFTP